MTEARARRGQDVEQTREQILEAAREAFVTLGYERTSVREVARRAGLSHGTIYLHFRDKDDLLYQVSEDDFRRLLARLRSLPRSQDPIQRLEDALRAVGHYGVEFPHQYQLMMEHRPASFTESGVPGFSPMAELVSGFLGDLIQEATKRNLLPGPVITLDGLAMIAAVHGVVSMHRLRLIDRETVEAALDHTVTLLLIALTGGSCQLGELAAESPQNLSSRP